MVILKPIGGLMDTSPEATLEREIAIAFGEIRDLFHFWWDHTDLFPIINDPCETKDCIRKRIEYFKNEFWLEEYQRYINQAPPLNYMAVSKANRLFYQDLIGDLMLVVDTFNQGWQYDLWNDVYDEYMDNYPDYAQDLFNDPAGFFIDTTIVPIVEVGADIITTVAEPVIGAVVDVAKATTTSLLSGLLGTDWKRKATIIGIAGITLTVLGLIGFQYSKTYITEKAKEKM